MRKPSFRAASAPALRARKISPRLVRATTKTSVAPAVAETTVSLQADLDGFGGTDAGFLDKFFVPGIQRAGGLRAAKMLVK